jgi:hypothetical protein
MVPALPLINASLRVPSGATTSISFCWSTSREISAPIHFASADGDHSIQCRKTTGKTYDFCQWNGIAFETCSTKMDRSADMVVHGEQVRSAEIFSNLRRSGLGHNWKATRMASRRAALHADL